MELETPGTQDVAVAENDFFSSDQFLTVLQTVYYPRAKPGLARCGTTTVRTLLNRGRAVSGFWPMPFPLETVSADQPALEVPYIADVVACELTADAVAPPGMEASPLVRWEQFRTFEDYERWTSHRPRLAQITTLRRQERRLGRDRGEVIFDANDDTDELFNQVIAWKSEQYSRSGIHDRFAGKALELYREFRRRGLLRCASLRADGRIVAGHLGMRWGGQFSYRLPAYDPASATYSPGAILLGYLLRDSFECGDRVFDFLIGAEPYKLRYATHVRYLTQVGEVPLRERALRQARSRVALMLQSQPRLLRAARRLERRAGSIFAR